MEIHRSLRFHLCISVILLLSIHHASSFYLPGVAPEDFAKVSESEQIDLSKTQLPYSYYSIPYCSPESIVDNAENLGEVLRGDRIENSPYVFKMRVPEMCNIICRKTLDAKSTKEFKEKISDEYRVNISESAIMYQHGYLVGLKENIPDKDEKHFIHNHLQFTVKYHKDPATDLSRIVGFEVKPFSSSDSPQEVEENKEIIFTYDVEFQESDIKWASRWDTYLLMADDQIHWFSIVNSLMIVLFLSGMVAMIMLRTLYRDISKYNQLETKKKPKKRLGGNWSMGMSLGHQQTRTCFASRRDWCAVFGMILVTMMFAVLGFSPLKPWWANDCYASIMGFHGSVRWLCRGCLYKMFKGAEWKKLTLKTAFMFPAIVFAIFFVLNALIWGEKSSGAVPFGTMFALVFLWFGISVPLVFVGSYIGFKKPAIEDPVKTNKIPRQIPEQAWYMNPTFSVLIGGILPFGAVFIELFFILTSIWLNQFYYIFGFLFILCSEDYLWWWRSYLTSGSSALYLFLYATFYFFTKLEITKPVSGVLYFGYMTIVSLDSSS
ncbi:hypothetical protein MKW92_012228 [Papaver armeniacum]|nr:hypothetical protein MKW92_012228 [Papaver armeniacum]